MSHSFYLQSLPLSIYQCLTDQTSLTAQPKSYSQSPAISNGLALQTLLSSEAWPWHDPLFPTLHSWQLSTAGEKWKTWLLATAINDFPSQTGFQRHSSIFSLGFGQWAQSSVWLILTKMWDMTMVNPVSEQSRGCWIKCEKKTKGHTWSKQFSSNAVCPLGSKSITSMALGILLLS